MTATQPAGEHHVGHLGLSGEGNRGEVASPISDGAIDLACLAMNDGVRSSHYRMRWEPEVRTILEAAYPAIRQQVAEEIAVKAGGIAEAYQKSAEDHRAIALEIGSKLPKGALHMRTALALKNNATGAWAVMHAARDIGGQGSGATSAPQAVGADLTAGANTHPSDPQDSQAVSKRLPGGEG